MSNVTSIVFTSTKRDVENINFISRAQISIIDFFGWFPAMSLLHYFLILQEHTFNIDSLEWTITWFWIINQNDECSKKRATPSSGLQAYLYSSSCLPPAHIYGAESSFA